MSRETFCDYRDLPEPVRVHLAAIEDFACDVDGKDIGERGEDADGKAVWYDGGTIVLSDEFVPAFNAIVAALRSALTAPEGER